MGVPISSLPLANALTGAEQYPIVQNGTTKRTTLNASGVTYDPAGTGAIATTVQSKLRETKSVLDFGSVDLTGAVSAQSVLVAAVLAAYTDGTDLYWPAGTYLSTANIPYFHSVRHIGPGVVKRGTNLFYVQPKDGQTNRLYLGGAGGSSSNDGLSASEPFNTFQPCFDATKNYGPVLEGNWELIASDGTYNFSAGAQTFSTPSKNRVVIRGPDVGGHPNVPTAIIDGGGTLANYLHGINCDGPGVYVKVQDIKAQNFKSAGYTRIGFVFANGCDGYGVNLHSLDCSWSGVYFKECTGRLGGGILDANNTGAYGFISDTTKMSFGYGATSDATGPQTKNAISAGVYWSTGSQGHIDYHQSSGNGVAVLVAENSRADVIGGSYDVAVGKIGIRAITGGMWGSGGVSPTFTGAGTYVEAKAYSGNIDELDDQGSGSWQRTAFDRTTRSASGIVSGTFPTVYTIPAYRLQGVGKSCRVVVHGVYTASASSSLTINFGGMALTLVVPAAATNEVFYCEATLLEVAGGYRAFGLLGDNLTAARTGTATAGFTNSSAQDVAIGYSLTGAGDSLNLYRTDVFLMG